MSQINEAFSYCLALQLIQGEDFIDDYGKPGTEKYSHLLNETVKLLE